jgi:hypothetical protein
VNISGLWLIQSLFSNTQTVDDFPVALGVLASQIVKQSPPLTDQLQQTSPGMIVLPMCLEVIREAVDSPREQCDLDFWRAGVGYVSLVLTNYLNLSFLS